MLFNSIDFALFFPLVFIIYWIFKSNIKIQNLIILASSYLFYGWWDYRFLSLIIISSLADYYIGISIANQLKRSNKNLLLLLSFIINLGFLGYFKYYNFFIDSFVDAFNVLGYELSPNSLNVVLPVGISFYTFQTLSYTIDVYRENLCPTKNIISFLSYVSFFPQLVAGPIERARNLLPQFEKERKVFYKDLSEGSRQIIWGFFKKILIADNAAYFVNVIFQDYENYNSTTLIIGAVLFAFQIYGDFSGYSDIAIGTSKLFGFKLMKNFAYPYFSRDIAEFWRRWHISLSTWFRDYLYIPLGGSKVSKSLQIRNVFIIFLVSGFWHGANWTFIFWGLLNAIFFLPLMLTNRNRRNIENIKLDNSLSFFKDIILIIRTFSITCFAWIFFRSEHISDALSYCWRILTINPFGVPNMIFPGGMATNLVLLFFLFLLIFVEWVFKEKDYALQDLEKSFNFVLRHSFYLFLLIGIYFFGKFDQSIEFIYFQF
jgi:D-alanyl-lipoteichoic acid acyltransferase DltB (MBOAT superfamily)